MVENHINKHCVCTTIVLQDSRKKLFPVSLSVHVMVHYHFTTTQTGFKKLDHCLEKPNEGLITSDIKIYWKATTISN